jgi:hypothetical protein
MTEFLLGPTSRAEVGQSPGLGCQRCALLDLCGGTFSDPDCFADCCNEPTKCTTGCPRSDHFAAVVQDAGGLETKRAWQITHSANDLPTYVPHIDNGYSRSMPLPSAYVALTTFDVVPPDSERVFSGPEHLREHFRLLPDARVLLLSVGKDNRLERFWQYSESRRLAKYLATLGIAHITAPNFSFPLDVPRPEHLVNRMRSLRSAERLSGEGLSVIPHLNAFNQKDWDCWRDFLRDHPHITLIAQEFQTGLASRKKASWHVWRMCNLEQSLGRGLHLVAVGGRRHLPLLVGLSGVTIVDSVPFVRACKRRVLDHTSGRWVINETPVGKPVDDLLRRNVAAYRSIVEATARALRQIGPLVPTAEPPPVNRTGSLGDAPIPVSELQLELWPAAPSDDKMAPLQPASVL